MFLDILWGGELSFYYSAKKTIMGVGAWSGGQETVFVD